MPEQSGGSSAFLAQVPLTWVDVDKVPIQFVNATLTQLDEFGDIIIAFGQVTPPAFTSTDPVEVKKQAERIAYVPVRPIARFTMSRERLEQVVGFLRETLANQDQYNAARRQPGSGR